MNNNYKINYNSDIVCTYRDFSNNYYSNLCYQIQILQIFNMIKYDDFILNKNIEAIYLILKNDEMILNTLKVFESKYSEIAMMSGLVGNKYLLFQLLFSYDYFDNFHKCFSKYLKSLRENKEKNSEYFIPLCKYIIDNKK